VTRGRHSLETTKNPKRRLALLTAPLVTALVIGAGVATSGFVRHSGPPSADAGNIGAAALTGTSAGPTIGPSATAAEADSGPRTLGTSRSVERLPLVAHRKPRPTGRLWTTANLNLRVVPTPRSATKGLLKSGQHVAVTGRHRGAYAEVIVGTATRWVTASYLSAHKEQKPAALGLVDRSCPGTQGTENGLTPAAVRVYRAVCNNFPQITTYGGYDAHGEHASGRAIDIMTSDTGLGNRIKTFLQANAGTLNLYDIIFQQHIWTPERAGEGWRSMPDRGSPTANHFDHVHVSVN
jgi:hypothetical protein